MHNPSFVNITFHGAVDVHISFLCYCKRRSQADEEEKEEGSPLLHGVTHGSGHSDRQQASSFFRKRKKNEAYMEKQRWKVCESNKKGGSVSSRFQGEKFLFFVFLCLLVIKER